MLKRFLIFAGPLALVFAIAAGASAQGGAVWQVQHYDLAVTLPAGASRDVSVKATVDVKNVSTSPAGTITLRISPNANVTAMAVNGEKADFTKGQEGTLQRLQIRMAGVPVGGTTKISADYTLTLKDNSDLAVASPIAAHLLPLSFWYPTPTSWYYSKGADRAPFTVRVVGSGLTSVSAGTATTVGFEQKSAGQPFFVAGQWDTADIGGVNFLMPKGVAVDGRKRAEELAAIYTEARAFIAKYLGAAPNVPLRIVAVRRGGGFADSGTVLVDDSVFRRQKVDALTATTIAEAAAKQWLAPAATGDGFGVISEGLSRYLATEFIASKFGPDVADAARTRQRDAFMSVARRDGPLALASPLDPIYYGEVANKGAMLFRLLERRVGNAEFVSGLKASIQDTQFTLSDIRENFIAQKDLVDWFLDKPTDMNLLAGLPQDVAGGAKIALRNSGSLDASVNVRGRTASGKALDASVTVRAQSFGEVTFTTTEKIVETEIDTDKLYPQSAYFDDVAPKFSDESDPVAAVKGPFDRKEFTAAEAVARKVMLRHPRFDEIRVLLGRILLGEGKAAEAEKEFRGVMAEALPSASSTAWALAGLAETSAASGKTSEALAFAQQAIVFDGDYGASLSARRLRTKLNGTTPIDPSIKAFFAAFDTSAAANKKAEIDSYMMPGEYTRFSSGVAGSAEKWQTEVTEVDPIDADEVLVETKLNIKLLNQNDQSGTAVFRLIKVGGAWKLAAVEIFEVS